MAPGGGVMTPVGGGVMAPVPLPDMPFGAGIGASDRRRLVAGVDLAFAHDGCALVICEHTDDAIEVIDYDFRLPRPGEPFDPLDIADLYMRRLDAVGCRVVVADVHYVEVVRRVARDHCIALVNAPVGEERTKSFILARHLTRSRAVRFPRIVADHLRKIQLVVRPGGGIGIQAPRTDGAGHADLAFALVAAIAIDARMHGHIGDAPTRIATHRGSWST